MHLYYEALGVTTLGVKTPKLLVRGWLVDIYLETRLHSAMLCLTETFSISLAWERCNPIVLVTSMPRNKYLDLSNLLRQMYDAYQLSTTKQEVY